MITFFVPGIPAQQGNHSRNQYGAVYETSKNHQPWRDSIIYAARAVRAGRTLEGPVRVDLCFIFPRPRNHYRTGANAHLLKDSAPRYKISAPDLDKLVRAALDAITIAKLWKDDAQAAEMATRKIYTEEISTTPGFETPGMHVSLAPATTKD